MKHIISDKYMTLQETVPSTYPGGSLVIIINKP